ncbi:MAG: glycosyltransferase family 2 protein [Candidatus Melainabacteria bacterium]|nr:glycosyltransferase family 2 protein [Candidatus Melainabacteria bacterium]
MSCLRVSIVIVNWKTPRLLAKCLDSVLADPRYAEFELYVIDNASGDESVAMLTEQYPSVHVIANTQNLGFSKACNQAIPDTKGRYVLLLNPDAVVSDNAITRLADFMDNHNNCGASGPKVLNPDGSLQLACRRSFPDPVASFFRLTYLSRLFPTNPLVAKYNLTYRDPDDVCEVDALSGSCMMVRREAIGQVGLLDEDIFMFGEDIDWCWRIKQAGWKVYYAPQAVVYHHHGASSRLRPVGATINLHNGMGVFYRKHLARKYPKWFNALVYSAIWARAGIFVLLNSLRGLYLRQSQDRCSANQILNAGTQTLPCGKND